MDLLSLGESRRLSVGEGECGLHRMTLSMLAPLATLIAFPSTGVVRVDSAQPQVSRSCVDAESQRRE